MFFHRFFKKFSNRKSSKKTRKNRRNKTEKNEQWSWIRFRSTREKNFDSSWKSAVVEFRTKTNRRSFAQSRTSVNVDFRTSSKFLQEKSRWNRWEILQCENHRIWEIKYRWVHRWISFLQKSERFSIKNTLTLISWTHFIRTDSLGSVLINDVFGYFWKWPRLLEETLLMIRRTDVSIPKIDFERIWILIM